jgi:four helix bundle protein
METKDNPVVRLSLQFAIEIIDFSEILNGNNKFVISKQLLKSGTSIGANVREAQHTESRDDFIHKQQKQSIGYCCVNMHPLTPPTIY